MTGESLLQTGLALALVLGLVMLMGWGLQRLGGRRRGKTLDVVSQVSLGQRERVVVVAWDGQEWMLGVGPGQVNLMAHRDAPMAEEPSLTEQESQLRALAAPSPVGAQDPGRFVASNEPGAHPAPPSFPQAFAQQLQQTLARWSQR